MEFSHDRDVAILARTPAVLRALLEGLEPAWTDSGYGPNTWSARQIVAHYVDNEIHDWIPRAVWILERGTSEPFVPYDRDGLRAFEDVPLAALLDLFERHRTASLASLREIPTDPASLARTGVHPAFGVVTLGQLLAAWVAHDLHHVGHICKAMAHQHRDEAGPWRQYISILDPPRPR